MKKILLVVLIISNTICLKSQVNTDKLLNIGMNALYFKDYVLSIQYFNQIINAKPYMEKPYLYRAFAKIYLDDYYGAISDIDSVIKRNQFIHLAYYAKGFINNKLKNYNEAEENFSKALHLSPENTTYIIGRLEAYDYQKKYDDELKDINFLIQKINDDPQLLLEKVRVQILLGDTIKTLNMIDSVLKLDTFNFNLWGARGMIYLITDKKEDALNDYNRAIKLKSDNFVHYINRGNILYEKKKFSEAIDDYDKAISLAPDNEQAIFNHSLIMFEIGDYNKAIIDLNKLIKANSNMFEAIYQRAIINQKLGKHNDVIDDLTKIIEKYPNFAPAYTARANSYHKLQNKKAANSDMMASLRIEEKQKQYYSKNKNHKEIDTDTKIAEEKPKVNEWAKLFETSNTDSYTNIFGENSIRGTIQNRQADVKLKEDFIVSTYKKQNDNRYFSMQLENINKQFNDETTLYFVLEELHLTDALIQYNFKKIDRISNIIQKDKSDNLFNNLLIRGILYFIVKDFDNAIKDFSAAIEIKKNPIAYLCRAVMAKKMIEVTTSSNKANNNINSIANNQKLLHDFENIISDYDKAIEMGKEFYFAFYNKANTLIVMKDYNNAIINYTKAIEINNNFAEAYFNRGLAYLFISETQKGIKDISKAGELGIYSAYNILKKITK